MTKLFLILSLGFFSLTAFADFPNQNCKISHLYDGYKMERHKGTFGLIKTSQGDYRMIYHEVSPTDKFYYNDGTLESMSSEEMEAFSKEWCSKLLSHRQCTQIKKIELVSSHVEDGLVFLDFQTEKGETVGRGAGIGGMIGICR